MNWELLTGLNTMALCLQHVGSPCVNSILTGNGCIYGYISLFRAIICNNWMNKLKSNVSIRNFLFKVSRGHPSTFAKLPIINVAWI